MKEGDVNETRIHTRATPGRRLSHMLKPRIRIMIDKLRRKGVTGSLAAGRRRLLNHLTKSFPRVAARYTFGAQYAPLGCDVRAPSQHARPDAGSFAFHFAAEEREKIITLIPASLRHRNGREADDIMSYRFRFSGVSNSFAGGIDWFVEPFGNKGWRWNLNRHSFLLTLARAYLYSKRTECAERIQQLISDWCDRNPYDACGRNWNEPFEIAARLNNWIWLYFLLKDTEHIPQETLALLQEGIYTHACHLHVYIEDDIPNNHLLLEAKALYEASLVLQGLPQAEKWRRKSWSLLKHQFRRQVMPDGGHSEQSTTYHRIVLSELLEMYALAQRNGNSEAVALLRDGLVAMCDFCSCLMRPDGTLPVIGDSTNVDTYYRFNPLMIAASVFDRPVYKNGAILLGEDDMTYFVLGLEGAEKYRCLTSEPTAVPLRCFTDSGYYVMRDPSLGLHAVIDCGPFCDKTIPAHGHDDILGFDLSLRDSPLIVDSGNDGLASDAPEASDWRAYFRGARAHNILLLDGHNRSELPGWRDVLRTAKPLRCEWHVDDRVIYFVGAHDGYLRTQGVIHQREMILVKGRFLCVIDKLLGEGNHQVDLLYHLAPDMRAVLNGQGTIEVSRDAEPWAMLSIFGLDGSVGIPHGCRNPIQGWVSFESGAQRAADTVRFHADGTLPLWIGTLVHSPDSGSWHVEGASCRADETDKPEARFTVSGDGEVYAFCSSTKGGNRAPRYSVQEGRFVLAKVQEGGCRETLYTRG